MLLHTSFEYYWNDVHNDVCHSLQLVPNFQVTVIRKPRRLLANRRFLVRAAESPRRLLETRRLFWTRRLLEVLQYIIITL